jgi:hypothetical protein
MGKRRLFKILVLLVIGAALTSAIDHFLLNLTWDGMNVAIVTVHKILYMVFGAVITAKRQS